MFNKAERRKAKLRLAITGPSGSGKTYGALLVALGLGGRIALIDTENGSGDLYAGLGDYDVCNILAPYTVQKYISAIHEAEQNGYDVLIIDSLSHAWAGEGGLLDQQGKIAGSGKGNSYTAWRQVTPLHNQLIETMLASRCHIIATMRSKTEYVLEADDKGRQTPRKVGMAPVQRDGVDYEFSIVAELCLNHTATVSKDRTSLFDGQVFKLSKDVGIRLKEWLESGVDAPVQHTPPVSQIDNALEARKQELYKGYMEVCSGIRDHAQNAMLKALKGKAWRDWTADDLNVLAFDLAKRRAAQSSISTAHEVPAPTTPAAPVDNGVEFEELDPAVA